GLARTMGSRAGAGPAARLDPRAHRHAAGIARHHPAAHEPVSQSYQELIARRRDRLSGHRLDREHDAQPDRPGDRRHRADHAGVPYDQPEHQPVDELVQRAHGTGGAMSDTTAKLGLETAVAGVPEAVPHAPPAALSPWGWV